MKVVLFCGGLGLRIRDEENVPKPMVTIGSYQPSNNRFMSKPKQPLVRINLKLPDEE